MRSHLLPCRRRRTPATACLTWLGEYSTTSQPALTASAMASPLAWATEMAVRTLTWKNTRSTATTSGRSSASSARSSSLQLGQPLRARGRPGSVRSTPARRRARGGRARPLLDARRSRTATAPGRCRARTWVRTLAAPPAPTGGPGRRLSCWAQHGRAATASTSSAVGRNDRPGHRPVGVAERRPSRVDHEDRPPVEAERARGCRRRWPTSLSASASSGKAKPPWSALKPSWLSTDWGLMASTWAPTLAELVDVGACRLLSWRVHTGVLSPG